MVTAQKTSILSTLTDKLKKVNGVILTEYHGLTVGEMEELRKDLKKINSKYMVIKNTICSIGLKQVQMGELAKNLSGPTAVLFIDGDVSLASKKIVDFSKEHNKLKIKSGYILGKVVTPEEIKKIAYLPSKEVLLGKFTGVLKMSLVNLVNVLQAPVRKFVCTLDAISKKK